MGSRTWFSVPSHGENMFVHPRVPEAAHAALAPVVEKALANEAAFEAKLAEWLVRRRTR